MYATSSDRELIELIRKKRSEGAFKVIYDRHWDNMFQAAYNLLKEEGIAKDTLQEVFVDLWNRIDQVEIENLGGYLYRAVRFQSLKQLRKLPPLDIHETRFVEILGVNNIEDELHYQDLHRTVEKSLEELPPKYKQIFELSRFQHLSNKEIADKLGISTRTVEWYLHNTLKHLETSIGMLLIVFL